MIGEHDTFEVCHGGWGQQAAPEGIVREETVRAAAAAAASSLDTVFCRYKAECLRKMGRLDHMTIIALLCAL